jgi:hypothetical protein
MSLPNNEKIAFLIVFSVICWTIWKHQNNLCFNKVPIKTGRNLIFLIISLLHYWLGAKRTSQQIQDEACSWMPTEEMLEDVPLRIWVPGDDQLVPYVFGGDGGSSPAGADSN